MLRGADKETIEKGTDLLSKFNRYQVDENTLFVAMALNTIYKNEYKGGPPKNIDDGDEIIAATVCLAQGYLLTANGKDFPEPFFKEIDRVHVEYPKKASRSPIAVYLKEC